MTHRDSKSLIGCGYGVDSRVLVPGNSTVLNIDFPVPEEELTGPRNKVDTIFSKPDLAKTTRVLGVLKGKSQSQQLCGRGQTLTAVHTISHALSQQDNTDRGLLLDRSKLLIKLGNYEAALESIEAVIQKHPHDDEAWALKAYCFSKLPLLVHRAAEVQRQADRLAPNSFEREIMAKRIEQKQAANRIQVMPIERGAHDCRKHGVNWQVINNDHLSHQLKGSWVSGEKLRCLEIGIAAKEAKQNQDAVAQNENPFYKAVASITARKFKVEHRNILKQQAKFLSKLEQLEMSATKIRAHVHTISLKNKSMKEKTNILATKGKHRTAMHLEEECKRQQKQMQILLDEASRIDIEVANRRMKSGTFIQTVSQPSQAITSNVKSSDTKLLGSHPFLPLNAPRNENGHGRISSHRSPSGRRLPPLLNITLEEQALKKRKLAAAAARRKEDVQKRREEERRKQLEQFNCIKISKMRLHGGIITQMQYDKRLLDLDAVLQWGCVKHHEWQIAMQHKDSSDSSTNYGTKKLFPQCSLCCECPILHAPNDIREDEEVFQSLMRKNFPGAGMILRYIQRSKISENYNLALLAVQNSPAAFEFVSVELRDNFKIASEAIKVDWKMAKFASKRLRGDNIIMSQAIRQNPQALSYATEIFSDHLSVLGAVRDDGELLRFCNLRLRSRRDVAEAALQARPQAACFLPPHLTNDSTLFKSALETHGASVLKYAGEILRSDVSFVLTAIKQDPTTLLFAHPNLCNNPHFILQAVSIDGRVLKYCNSQMQGTPAIAFAAVRQAPLAMEFVAASLRNDVNFVKQCMQVKSYVTGHILKHASCEIQNNFDIVKSAVECNGMALQFASSRLQGQMEICRAAAKQNGISLSFSKPHIRANQEVVTVAVKQNGAALQYAHHALRANFEVVLAAVQKTGRALTYASNQLRRMPQIIFAAVHQDKTAIEFVDSDTIDGDSNLLAFFRDGQKIKEVPQHGSLQKQLRVLEMKLGEAIGDGENNAEEIGRRRKAVDTMQREMQSPFKKNFSTIRRHK